MWADIKNKHLYETRPDIFPEGYETPIERALLARYHVQKNAKP